MVVVAAVWALAGSSPAVAQQQPDAELAGASGTTPPPASADPNIDRAFIQPTAMTQPAGSLTYNNYELLLHGVTYGITDHVQATLTVLPPIIKDMPLMGAAAIKGRVSPSPRLHLAAQGTVGFMSVSIENDSGSTKPANVVSLGAGGYASICLRDDCSSLLNASANYQYAANYNYSGSAHLVIYGGSLVLRASEHVKLLGEITSAAGRSGSSGSSFSNLEGFLVSYGLRFHTTALAADVGFIKPVATSGSSTNDGWVMGLPFASVSYRWN
jgi:hypothetical protein